MYKTRHTLDRALVALIFTLMIAGIIVLTVVKRDLDDMTITVPLTTTVDILEEKAQPIPKQCDFGGCPVAIPVVTEPETEELMSQEPCTEAEEAYDSEAATEELIFTDLCQETEEEQFVHYQDTYEGPVVVYSPEYFERAGLIDFNGWTWSWYSERVLPGTGLDIPGRYTCHQGFVRDWEGYICLASDVLEHGTVVWTPFGSYGKVYDCGVGNSDWIDVYVGW